MVVMPCVDFAKVAALLRSRLPRGHASPQHSHKNRVGRHEDLPSDVTQPRSHAASERTFPKGNTIGKKQCSLLALDAMWLPFSLLTNHPMGRTLVCTTPAVFYVQKSNNEQ